MNERPSPFEDSILTRREPPPPGSAPPPPPVQGSALARLADAQVEVGGAPIATLPEGERYEVLGVLGEGGMGTVLAAKDRALGRRVALKVAKGTLSPDLVRRFQAETQVTAQLDHPGVVPVYGVERGPHGEPAYAMKLVRGRGLDDVITLAAAAPPWEGERGLGDRLGLFLRVCEAVAFAHKKGVVHRDLKPANIMVGNDGEVFVVDWGLAKVGLGGAVAAAPAGSPPRSPSGSGPTGTEQAGQTQEGTLVGTPAYMASEQALGEHEKVGPQSDQAALGLILFELVHLQRAYDAASLTAAVNQASLGKKVAPRRAAPPELAAIIARATALEPGDRYPSVAALAEDVRRTLRGEAPTVLPDSAWRALLRRAARRPGRLVGGGLAVVAVAALLVVVAEARRRVGLADEQARAAAREQRLGEVLGRVAERAQQVTTALFGHEAVVEGLSGAAGVVLTRDAPGHTRLYRPADFEAPATAPPDTAQAARYGRPVSLDWPVLHAPSDAPAGALADLERLAGLRDRQATALRTGPDGALLGARWREQVRDEGAAVAWAYVAAEETGAITLLPGMRTTWAPTYDPRRRPWYVAAKEAWQRGVRGRSWTAPYVDGLLRRPVVACVAPVVAPGGELLGVAAIDLDAQELARRALGLEGLPGARRLALLDPRGQELLATGGFAPGTGAESGELTARAFGFPGVVEGVVAGRSGRLAGVAPDGTPVLLVWARLAPLEWTLVVELSRGE